MTGIFPTNLTALRKAEDLAYHIPLATFYITFYSAGGGRGEQMERFLYTTWRTNSPSSVKILSLIPLLPNMRLLVSFLIFAPLDIDLLYGDDVRA